MQKFNWVQTILTVVLIFGVSTALFLYTSGYRLEKNENNKVDLRKTGMVSAKSIPEGAAVYLDGILLTATNDTISGIEPGTRKLKIVRKGFVPWEKDIEIFQELVTDITAVLITQSTRIEPITNTGAAGPSVSPSLTKVAYFSKDDTKPGIGIISMTPGVGFFRSEATVVLPDTRAIKYSQGKNIEWSDDEKNLLVETQNGTWYLVDLNTNTAHTTNVPQTIRDQWQEKLTKKREDFVKNAEVTDAVKQLAASKKVIWAPDDKKFLSVEENGQNIDYKVYDLENPLPVGEKAVATVFSVGKTQAQPKVSWYADSFHLVLVEGDVAKEHKGKVSFVRIDGTNKTEIYNNTLYSDNVFSSPQGDKVIILSSFKSTDQTDLYTVSIR